MNKYVKDFCLRGLMFGGFGPIVAGIVLFIVSFFEDVALGGKEILLAIVSTYILAFAQAGASVFNQVEHWSILKSVAVHFSLLYVVYVCCYLINSWIPFEINVVLIFTAIFVISYFIIWTAVYCIVKKTAKELNRKIK